MPLMHSASPKALAANMAELMHGKPGKTRQKGIQTLAKKRGISPARARSIMSYAIAKNVQSHA